MPRKPQLERGEKMERDIVFADAQVPYHDPRAFRLLLDFIDFEENAGRGFDKAINLGDHWDATMFTLSFARDPRMLSQIRHDRDVIREHYRKLKESTKAEQVWIEGNHERRLMKYLLERAPEAMMLLSDNDDPWNIPEVLGIGGVQYILPYGEVMRRAYNKGRDEFIYKHGDKHGLYASKRELEAVGHSGMSGHNHRFQVSAMTREAGSQTAWWSLPAMCNIRGQHCPPGYMTGTLYRNWQQGFADVWYSKERPLFEVAVHIIEEGRMVANGRYYEDVRGK